MEESFAVSKNDLSVKFGLKGLSWSIGCLLFYMVFGVAPFSLNLKKYKSFQDKEKDKQEDKEGTEN